MKIAVKGTALDTDELKAQLKGTTGIAFSFEEPSVAAKVVRDFRKVEANAAKLQVKCGVLENAVMAGNRVETELASLPGKDEVRAMLLAQLLAPMQKLVMQLNAPAQNLNFALDARRRQLEERSHYRRRESSGISKHRFTHVTDSITTKTSLLRQSG